MDPRGTETCDSGAVDTDDGGLVPESDEVTLVESIAARCSCFCAAEVAAVLS
jgi:hypothetical protein